MTNAISSSALLIAFALASSSAIAGGGGCGDQCPKYAKTHVCTPIEEAQIVDPSTLTDKWNLLSVSAMKKSLANRPLKVSLYKTIWSAQPYDPEAFVQAWIEGLVVGQNYGQGFEDLATGALDYSGNSGTSTGWENLNVQIHRAPGEEKTSLQLISTSTNIVLLSASMNCEPVTNP